MGEYSAGMKRKIGIVQAFQSDPELLILDEPTEGLDPLMQEAFYALLAETRRRGRTVFMSSHVLSEVDRVCDRIGVLREGRLVLDASVDEVRRIAPRTVCVTFSAPVSALPSWPDGVSVESIEPTRWRLRASREIGGLVGQLSAYPVADLGDQRTHARGRRDRVLPGAIVMRAVAALAAMSVRRMRGLLLAMTLVTGGLPGAARRARPTGCGPSPRSRRSKGSCRPPCVSSWDRH